MKSDRIFGKDSQNNNTKLVGIIYSYIVNLNNFISKIVYLD